MGVLQVWPHYDSKEVRSMDEVRELMGDGADELNWLFCSTSGVHGSYTTLDELEKWEGDEEERPSGITILIVRPRLVSVRYGHVDLSEGDIPWLRKQVNLTLKAVAASQEGNR